MKLTGSAVKNAVVVVFVLLAVCAYYLIEYQKSPNLAASAPVPAPVATVQASPVAAFRIRREQTRAQETNMLLALVENELAAEGTRALAQELLLAAAQNAERELLLEGAIAAMGLDAVCAVRDGSVVLFTQKTLSEQEAARLVFLAGEHADARPENVKIFE